MPNEQYDSIDEIKQAFIDGELGAADAIESLMEDFQFDEDAAEKLVTAWGIDPESPAQPA